MRGLNQCLLESCLQAKGPELQQYGVHQQLQAKTPCDVRHRLVLD